MIYSLHWVLRPASIKGVEIVKPNWGRWNMWNLIQRPVQVLRIYLTPAASKKIKLKLKFIKKSTSGRQFPPAKKYSTENPRLWYFSLKLKKSKGVRPFMLFLLRRKKLRHSPLTWTYDLKKDGFKCCKGIKKVALFYFLIVWMTLLFLYGSINAYSFLVIWAITNFFSRSQCKKYRRKAKVSL